MNQDKIGKNDLAIGKPLPWPVYTSIGTLLLQKGMVIQSEQQRDALFARGLYREPGKSDRQDAEDAIPDIQDCPFDIIQQIPARLRRALAGLERADANSINRILRIARDVQALCASDTDAALGSVHLWNSHSYPITHLVHVAILSEILMRSLEYTPQKRLSVIAGALTSNIAMLDMQELLARQAHPLDPQQRAELEQHPSKGFEILKTAGVQDTLWLDVVLQHHEQPDGSGYGNGTSDIDICPEALLVRLADIYAAMIAPREYRPSLMAKDALKEIFLSRGQEVDESLAVVFIKSLGVFPPGALVSLKNGETAVVTHRGPESTSPVVHSVLSPDGRPYARPLKRVCNQPGFSVRSMLPRMPKLHLNLPMLWDYA